MSVVREPGDNWISKLSWVQKNWSQTKKNLLIRSVKPHIAFDVSRDYFRIVFNLPQSGSVISLFLRKFYRRREISHALPLLSCMHDWWRYINNFCNLFFFVEYLILLNKCDIYFILTRGSLNLYNEANFLVILYNRFLDFSVLLVFLQVLAFDGNQRATECLVGN